MNLPNKLTIGRIALVPFLIAAMLIDFPLNNLVALIIFIVASITDMLDGKLARKHNLVTDFGKFADPLADKILVLAAFLCFVQNGLCDCIAVIIVLFREFAVTSIRLVAASKGKVIAANMWGKAKTVSQIVAIIAILAMQTFLELPEISVAISPELYLIFKNIFSIANEAVVWISTILAMISGIVYVIQNRQFISEK